MNSHWIEERFALPADRSPGKVAPLEASLRRHVKPGMTLHFGYSQARLMALSNALVRTFFGTDTDFKLVSAGIVANQAALLATGLVRHLTVSFAGENFPTPAPNPVVQRALDSSAVQIQHQSLLVISQRLAAGAYGFPFAPTRSLRDSSLSTPQTYRRIKDPFGGTEEIGVVPAIVPDITFVHGVAADPHGNVLLSPPYGEGELSGFAARLGVIATVERIVPSSITRRLSHLVKIPAHRVLSVSEVPLGSHPYGLYAPEGTGVAGYVEDREFFGHLHTALATPERFDAWIREWILDLDGHTQYVQKLGQDKVAGLRAAAAPDKWREDLTPDVVTEAARTRAHGPIEAMIVAASRVVKERALAAHCGVIAAGVGFANLAAWLAARELQDQSMEPPELIAEIGLYGYSPRPGEPFIFSNRNIGTCKMLTTSEAILGLHVSGRHNRCLAVIGAGQIDRAGNINSTYDAAGGFLVGSGGANDICSAASDVIAITRQSAGRLVAALPYVTSPGHAVSTLVTDGGVFEKRNGQFVLTRTIGPRSSSVEWHRAHCGWDLQMADDLQVEFPPTPDELMTLRLYDPGHEFVPRPA